MTRTFLLTTGQKMKRTVFFFGGRAYTKDGDSLQNTILQFTLSWHKQQF